jgi:hypothetical protein
MPRVLPLIATAAILAPLAGHSAILVIDAPSDPLSIAGDDIARILDGADLASLIARERAVVEMTGGRVLDYALSGDARATLAGGEIGTVALSDRATASFGGNFNGTQVTLTGNARADVRGGSFLRGGFVISDAATVHVYASDFSFTRGQLRYFLQDGTPRGLLGDHSVARTDDPLAPMRGDLMPEGLCVHIGGNVYCGPTLFYSATNAIQLQGADRMTVVEGGSAGFIEMNDQSILDIRGGSAGTVRMRDDARGTISGGTAMTVLVGGRSNLVMRGGAVSSLEVLEGGVADVVARDATYNGFALRGTWTDGTPFATNVRDPFGSNGPFMPGGLCVSIGDARHCGPTVFYRADFLDLAGDQAVTLVDGAEVSSLYMLERSHVNLHGGTVGIVSMNNDATASMTGGLVQDIRINGRSHLTVSGGQFGRGNLSLLGDGRVDVVARSARYGFGGLEGEWADGTSFWISVTSEIGNNQFMPKGMCVVRGADTYCGATLFYESNGQYYLGGTDRVAVVDGALLVSLWAHGEAVVDVRGGSASSVDMLEHSHLAMSGGRIGIVSLREDASADLLGGQVDELSVRHRGTVTLSDMEGLSYIDLTGLDGGHVTVKVLAATFSGGRVVGTWVSGSAFELIFYGVDDASFSAKVSVVAVPEPATWLSMVLGLGALVGVRVRSRAKRRKGVMTGASGMKREEEHGVA